MVCLLLLLAPAWLGWAGPSAPDEPPPATASDRFFASPTVPRIDLRLDEDQLAKLRADPRVYVHAKLREDDHDLAGDVAVKLKGAAGSFREWDDRPALTVNLRKFHKGGQFHGLTRFHLNNSAQDEAYFNEILAAELFHQAGVPAPRVTFARVRLNGRDVGLYVLKEGFDRTFLERSFANPTGNLYDGGFLQDLDADLEKDEGAGTDDRSDLRAIVAATADSDPTRRRERVEALVDMDAFCTFMALERMIGHWDGYSDKANNYRIYFDPTRHRAVFLPHGMDQIFEDPEAGLFGPSGTLVAARVLESNALRHRYRERLTALIPLMAPPDAMLRRVDEIDARLRPILTTPTDPASVPRRAEQVASLKARLIARAASLRRQLDAPEEGNQAFDAAGTALVAHWWPQPESDGAILDEVARDGEPKPLHIQAPPGQPCVASWRSSVTLGPGTYTFQASVRTDQVVTGADPDRRGVGVGRSGTPRAQHRTGTIAAEQLSCPFTVREDSRQVILVLELRADSGQVWFDRASCRLTRTGPVASE